MSEEKINATYYAFEGSVRWVLARDHRMRQTWLKVADIDRISAVEQPENDLNGWIVEVVSDGQRFGISHPVAAEERLLMPLVTELLRLCGDSK